ncbi:MAG: hypothetical protein JKY52_19510 [Flavobacteriales bacterium]|nr:hypothetical protein [Flavobacteriales bacterium]
MEAANWMTDKLDEGGYDGKLATMDSECFYLALGINPDKPSEEEKFDFPIIEFRCPINRQFLEGMWDEQSNSMLNPFRSFWAALIRKCQSETKSWLTSKEKEEKLAPESLKALWGIRWVLKIGPTTVDGSPEHEEMASVSCADIKLESKSLLHAAIFINHLIFVKDAGLRPNIKSLSLDHVEGSFLIRLTAHVCLESWIEEETLKKVKRMKL